jgi:hypothetical protein
LISSFNKLEHEKYVEMIKISLIIGTGQSNIDIHQTFSHVSFIITKRSPPFFMLQNATLESHLKAYYSHRKSTERTKELERERK